MSPPRDDPALGTVALDRKLRVVHGEGLAVDAVAAVQIQRLGTALVLLHPRHGVVLHLARWHGHGAMIHPRHRHTGHPSPCPSIFIPAMVPVSPWAMLMPAMAPWP